MFSDKEIAYLKSQRLARLATVSRDGKPDVAPVGFDFDGKFFYVGGVELARTRKFKNVQVNSPVAIAIDDLESVEPMKPRGIKIDGVADLVTHQGYTGRGTYIRIEPRASTSWGIEAPAFQDGKPVTKRSRAR